MCTYCFVFEPKSDTIRLASGSSYERKLTTASNDRPPRTLLSASSSVTSATSVSTVSGSRRPRSLWPRLTTVTRMPVSTDSRTQEALIVPVPPR
jgi:hypothetical protein